MITLIEALSQAPWRLLLLIARRRGLSLSSKIGKAELINRLAQTLPEPANLRPALVELPPPALAALGDIIAAGGTIFLPYLAPRHGHLRPPQQTPGHYHSAASLAGPLELSPLEQLRAVGLIFYHQPDQQIFIPTELLPLLRTELPLEDEPLPDIPFSQPSPATLELVCHDLAAFLALLQREEIFLPHGRWLPTRFLEMWGGHCRVSPALAKPTSELQTGRRRFLHYLAESAGLIPAPLPLPNRLNRKNREPEASQWGQRLRLTPTPAGGLWLQASEADRLQRLWLAWTQPEPDRWQRYRLPGAGWLAEPADLLQPLHASLAAVDQLAPGPFTRRFLQQQPRLITLLPVTVMERSELLAEIVIELLTGPLSWLGILEKDHSGIVTPPGQVVKPASPSLFLSRSGRAWLAGETPRFDRPAAAKFALSFHPGAAPFESFLSLELQEGLPEPSDLATAIEIASPEPILTGKGEKARRPEEGNGPPAHFRVTAPSFIRALQRGWSPPALVAALNRLATRPLEQAVVGLLKTWAEAAQEMVLYPAMILEVAKPEILIRLASSRRGRPLIHRTLSPRAVVVDSNRLDQLIRRLTEQEGVPPLVQGGKETETQDSASASLVWLALQVYQELGRFIPTPVRLPQTAFDQVAGLISPADLAAVQVAKEKIVKELQRALAGWVAFPPWPEEGLPEAKSLPVIEQALAAGQNLELLYHAAGSDTLTRRVVEPYRIERRGETPYLVGFCHHAQAERTFRLDRIREIEVVERRE